MSRLFVCLLVVLPLCHAIVGHATFNPSSSSSFTFVRRFAKPNEVTNRSGSTPSGNIIEMTEFIGKAAKSVTAQEFPSSFTIVTKVRSNSDQIVEQQQQLQLATARRADVIIGHRGPNKISHIKSSKGTFTLVNGMIVFARKNNTSDDNNSDSSMESAPQRTTTTTTRVAPTSTSTPGFSSTEKTAETSEKHPDLNENVSFTFLPTPAWTIGNKSVSKSDFHSQIETSARSKNAAKRFPTVRLDKNTVFVPAASYDNGTILYNQLGIEDFLKSHEENVTLYDFPVDSQTTMAPPNVPLSHMEILYPGFRDVVKQKPSQIIIQNIFVTPKKEPLVETNTLSQEQMDQLPNGVFQLQNATNVFVVGHQTTTSLNEEIAEGGQAESATQHSVTTSLSPAAPISASTLTTKVPGDSPTTESTTPPAENSETTWVVPSQTDITTTTTVPVQIQSLLSTTTSAATTVSGTLESATLSATTDNVAAEFLNAGGPGALTIPPSENPFLLNHSLYYNRSSTTTEGSRAVTVPLEIDPQFVSTLVDKLLTNGNESLMTLPTVSRTADVDDIPQPSNEPFTSSIVRESPLYIPDQSTGTSTTTLSEPTLVVQKTEVSSVKTTAAPATTSTTAPSVAASPTTLSSSTTEGLPNVVGTTLPSKQPGKTSSLASMILAHTAALMAGKPSPLRNKLTSSVLEHKLNASSSSSDAVPVSTRMKPDSVVTVPSSALYGNIEKLIPTGGKQPYPVIKSQLDKVSITLASTTPVTTVRTRLSTPATSTTALKTASSTTTPKKATSTAIAATRSTTMVKTSTSTTMPTKATPATSTTTTTQTTSSRLTTRVTSPTVQTNLTTARTATTSDPVTDNSTVDDGIYMEPDLDYSSVFFNSTESNLNVTDADDQDYTDDDRFDAGFSNETRGEEETTTTLPESSIEEDLQWVTQLSANLLSTAEDSIKSAPEATIASVETVSQNLAVLSTSTNESAASSTAAVETTKEKETTTAASHPQTTMRTSTVAIPWPHAGRINYFSCGDSSSGIDVNFVNPSFPGPDLSKGRCTFQLMVRSRHICQLRVDFNDTRMLLPRQGFCLDQYLTVTGAVLIPGVETFCGRNPDQHFYLELTESLNLAPRIVEFHVATAAEGYLYRYGLRIRQIDCNLRSEIRAPRGCFQYYTQGSGLIKSFNYEGGQYYNNANYRICVRTVSRGCAIALMAPEGGFGIHKVNSRKVPMNRAGVGSRVCRRDYLWIPLGVKEEQSLSFAQDRYCGAKLSSLHGDSRTKPVVARLSSSIYSMEFRSGTPRKFNAMSHGPGFRLSYTQLTYCPPGEISAVLQRASTSTLKIGGPVNGSMIAEDANRDILRFAALEDMSEDYYDDDSVMYKPTQSSVNNVTFTEHLNQLIKASLWISKVARNVTHGINW